MPSEALPAVSVTVRIEQSKADEIQGVIDALKLAGLTDIERQDRFLIAHGLVEADRLQSLERVEGVASVRVARTYKAS